MYLAAKDQGSAIKIPSVYLEKQWIRPKSRGWIILSLTDLRKGLLQCFKSWLTSELSGEHLKSRDD